MKIIKKLLAYLLFVSMFTLNVSANGSSMLANIQNIPFAVIDINDNVVKNLPILEISSNMSEEEISYIIKNNIDVFENAVLSNDSVYWIDSFVENIVKKYYPEKYEVIKMQKDNNGFSDIANKARTIRQFTKSVSYTFRGNSNGYVVCNVSFTFYTDSVGNTIDITNATLTQGNADKYGVISKRWHVNSNNTSYATLYATFVVGWDVIYQDMQNVTFQIKPAIGGTFSHTVTVSEGSGV